MNSNVQQKPKTKIKPEYDVKKIFETFSETVDFFVYKALESLRV